MSFLDPISGFFSRVSRSVPFSKKKDPRRGGGPINDRPGVGRRLIPCDCGSPTQNPTPNPESTRTRTDLGHTWGHTETQFQFQFRPMGKTTAQNLRRNYISLI